MSEVNQKNLYQIMSFWEALSLVFYILKFSLVKFSIEKSRKDNTHINWLKNPRV